MSSVNINVRTDADIKRKAERIFNELGLNMSTAVNMFLKQTIRANGIPFDLRLEIPNEETKAALAEYKEMKGNKAVYPRYSSFDELLSEVAEDVVDYQVK